MEHKWVKYSNPRNQRIKVEACDNCGIIKSAVAIKSRKCIALDSNEHAMHRLGWLQVMPFMKTLGASFA